MAEMLQTKATAESLLIYGRELEPYDIEDIATACRRIGMARKREDGKAIWFPICGDLVAAVRQAERQRKDRIRPEQLRPEVREALARDEQRKLGAGEPMHDVRGLIDQAKTGFNMPQRALTAPVPPAVVQAAPCPHCGHETSPRSSKTLFLLSDYYRKRAENAADAEAVKDNCTPATEV